MALAQCLVSLFLSLFSPHPCTARARAPLHLCFSLICSKRERLARQSEPKEGCVLRARGRRTALPCLGTAVLLRFRVICSCLTWSGACRIALLSLACHCPSYALIFFCSRVSCSSWPFESLVSLSARKLVLSTSQSPFSVFSDSYPVYESFCVVRSLSLSVPSLCLCLPLAGVELLQESETLCQVPRRGR